MTEITEDKLELVARKEADRGRNQALGVFVMLGAIVGLLAFLQLDQTATTAAKREMERVGAEQILNDARSALEKAKNAQGEAEKLLASIEAGDPDFDSGWFEAGFNSQYPMKHNIGAIPRRYTVLFKEKESADTVHLANQIWVLTPKEGGRGVMITHIDRMKMFVRTGSQWLFDTHPAHHGSTRIYTRTGYLRVMCWK